MQKGMISVLAGFMMAISAQNVTASEWEMNSFQRFFDYEFDGEEHAGFDYWLEIQNTSSNPIVGLGVGLSFEFTEDSSYTISYPRESWGSTVGDWWGLVVTKDDWSIAGSYDAMFSGEWDEFGFSGYEHAYIAWSQEDYGMAVSFF